MWHNMNANGVELSLTEQICIWFCVRTKSQRKKYTTRTTRLTLLQHCFNEIANMIMFIAIFISWIVLFM